MDLQVFHYVNEPIRVVDRDGEPWFVAKDVCNVLGLTRMQDSVRYLDEDETGECLVGTSSGNQRMTVVSEPGLYSLILKSRKPEAKAFKRWVTHEVLPQIRKTGQYTPTLPNFEDPAEAAEAWAMQFRKAQALEEENAEQKELLEWITVDTYRTLYCRNYWEHGDKIKFGQRAKKICEREGIPITKEPREIRNYWGDIKFTEVGVYPKWILDLTYRSVFGMEVL